jgi:cell division protein FtsN
MGKQSVRETTISSVAFATILFSLILGIFLTVYLDVPGYTQEVLKPELFARDNGCPICALEAPWSDFMPLRLDSSTVPQTLKP